VNISRPSDGKLNSLAAGNLKAIALLKQLSPVAWRHIHSMGQYTFRSHAHRIDLEAFLASVNLA